MEKKEQIKNIILVFSTIMKSMINPSFKITNPEGGVNQQTIGKCLDLLEADFGDAISRERLVDFCVGVPGIQHGFQIYRQMRCDRLLALIADRRKHPLYKFIFPQYEESTKSRALNTDVGYYICGQSTLLWTPFSVSCQQCVKAEACKQRTRQAYPELYRIRTEEFNQNETK